MDDETILAILEQHDFDTSLDWESPDIGFSADELLAMALYDNETPESTQQYLVYDAGLTPDWTKRELEAHEQTKLAPH